MRRSKWASVGLGSLSFAVIFVIWSAVTYTRFVSDVFLPTPSELVHGAVMLFVQRGFLWDIGISALRIIIGFVIAVMLAIPIGIALGLSRRASQLLEPVVDFIRYIPNPALIPLFILWFGVGETEKIIVISQTVFFQLVLMVANSVSFTPKEIIESAQTLGATRWHIITRVIFPYIKPRIYDDLRISIGWAWTALMAAEIVGASSGIGLIIVEAQRLLRTPNVVAGILTIGILGLITDITMKLLYPVFFPWAPKLEHHA